MISTTALRRFVTVFSAMSMVGVLSACGSSSSTPSAGSAPATDAPVATNPNETVSPVETSAAAPTGGYGPATVDLRLTGDRTTAVTEPLADGVYWASQVVSNGTTVTFTLGQWFACDGEGVPDQPAVECVSGFGTLDDPSATVALAADATVTVATGDLDDPTRSNVSPAEYTRLVGGSAPAADAPPGYAFATFATWVEVRGGSAVAVEQFYTS